MLTDLVNNFFCISDIHFQKQMDQKTARKCTFKDSQRSFLRALYIHDKFNLLFLIVEKWHLPINTIFTQFAAIWQCRYLTKKIVKNFARKPSQSFICRYLTMPLFDRKQCTQNTLRFRIGFWLFIFLKYSVKTIILYPVTNLLIK